MTDSNWPDPMRPGVPLFPERDGWHLTIHSVLKNPTAVFWCASEQVWKLGSSKYEPADLGDAQRKYIGPALTPAQINEMLAGKYSLPVIQTALRVWNALDDCDRTDADDMIFLENNGLMTRGIVEDADDFEDLEVGEAVWNFNAAGHALVAAIRNLGAAP